MDVRGSDDGKIVSEPPKEIKLLRDEPKLSKEDSQETRHLKELLLLHLDLIQQQQETILMKDRQLQAQVQEKSALQCRLDRMERRMALLRQQQQSQQRAVVEWEPDDNSSVGSPGSSRGRGEHGPRSSKRRGSLMPQRLAKRFKHERSHTDSEGENRSPMKRGAQDSATTRQKLALHRLQLREQDEKLAQLKQLNKRVFVTSVCQRTKKDRLLNSAGEPHFEKPRNISIGGRHQDNRIFRTDQMYHITVSNNDTAEGGLSPVRNPSKQCEVEVPTWRVVQIPRGYQMEGTENLDDEIYAKRHQKPEAEEKRRKRWDMQRLREERMKEKLQGRQGGDYEDSDDEESSPLDTFLPSPDKALYIEVQDSVPVAAFGLPIPKLKPQEFDIPWFNAEKRDREERSRSCSRKRRL